MCSAHPACSKNEWIQSLLFLSHSFMVLSSLDDTIKRSSGENLKEMNQIFSSLKEGYNSFLQLGLPRNENNVYMSVCVFASYLAQRTQLVCWLREKINFCLWTVHTLIVLSSEAVTRVCPSPEKLTLRTVAVWALKAVDSAFLHTDTNTTIKFRQTTRNQWVLRYVCLHPCWQQQEVLNNCPILLFLWVTIFVFCGSCQVEKIIIKY